MTNREMPGGDLATLLKFRTASACGLLVITPFIQISVTRFLPLAIAVSLLLLIVGHFIVNSKQLRLSYIRKTLDYTNWSTGQKLMLFAYGAFVAWTAVSLTWSPTPQKGYRDIVSLIAFAPLVGFLSHEFSKIPTNRIASFLRWGITLSALLLILELNGLTNLRSLTSSDHPLFDLNRNAVVLSLIIWTLPLFWRETKLNALYDAIPMALTMIVQYQTQSQAAQIAFILAAFAGIAVSFWRPVLHLIFAALILGVLLFPTVVPHIESYVAHSQNPILVNGHAQHRVNIWKDYANKIEVRPIIGWGARADRYLGPKDTQTSKKFGETTAHPHNFILEIWVTIGFIGALLTAAVFACFWAVVWSMPNRRSLIAAQLTVGAYAYAATGASMMQGWWIATLLLVISIFRTATKASQAEQHSG